MQSTKKSTKIKLAAAGIATGVIVTGMMGASPSKSVQKAEMPKFTSCIHAPVSICNSTDEKSESWLNRMSLDARYSFLLRDTQKDIEKCLTYIQKHFIAQYPAMGNFFGQVVDDIQSIQLQPMCKASLVQAIRSFECIFDQLTTEGGYFPTKLSGALAYPEAKKNDTASFGLEGEQEEFNRTSVFRDRRLNLKWLSSDLERFYEADTQIPELHRQTYSPRFLLAVIVSFGLIALQQNYIRGLFSEPSSSKKQIH
jgi:hypothetical protein